MFSCTVTPSAAAALAGNSVSVTCKPIAGVEYINFWKRQNANILVYAPGRDTTNRTVAGGYSVDDSDKSQIILTLNEVSIHNFDNYECFCTNSQSGQTKGSAYISMIGW